MVIFFLYFAMIFWWTNRENCEEWESSPWPSYHYGSAFCHWAFLTAFQWFLYKNYNKKILVNHSYLMSSTQFIVILPIYFGLKNKRFLNFSEREYSPFIHGMDRNWKATKNLFANNFVPASQLCWPVSWKDTNCRYSSFLSIISSFFKHLF